MEAVQQTSYCYIDETNEDVTEHSLLRCFECGHVFQTQQDLVDACNELAIRMDYPTTLLADFNFEAVTYCPLCLHDLPPI